MLAPLEAGTGLTARCINLVLEVGLDDVIEVLEGLQVLRLPLDIPLTVPGKNFGVFMKEQERRVDVLLIVSAFFSSFFFGATERK